jgi:hypothetical protein
VVPIQSFSDGASAAVGFAVGDADVRELGRVAHPDRSPVRRTLVVGDRVVTVSDSGVATSDLSTLRSRSWLAFTG